MIVLEGVLKYHLGRYILVTDIRLSVKQSYNWAMICKHDGSLTTKYATDENKSWLHIA